jgi:hypothetical protein
MGKVGHDATFARGEGQMAEWMIEEEDGVENGLSDRNLGKRRDGMDGWGGCRVMGAHMAHDMHALNTQ